MNLLARALPGELGNLTEQVLDAILKIPLLEGESLASLYLLRSSQSDTDAPVRS